MTPTPAADGPGVPFSHFPSSSLAAIARGGISPPRIKSNSTEGTGMTRSRDLRPALGAGPRPSGRGRRRLCLRPHRRSPLRPGSRHAVRRQQELGGDDLRQRPGHARGPRRIPHRPRRLREGRARRQQADHRDRGRPAEHHRDPRRDPRRSRGRHPRPRHLLRRLQEARFAALRQDALRVDRGRHQAAPHARQDVPRSGDGDRQRPAAPLREQVRREAPGQDHPLEQGRDEGRPEGVGGGAQGRHGVRQHRPHARPIRTWPPRPA